MADSLSDIPSPQSTPRPAEDAPSSTINRLLTGRRLSWYTKAKFLLVRAFLRTWVHLFGLTGLYWFGSVFATIEFLINRGRRKRYRRVLATVFPEGLRKARELRIIRSYFRRTRCDKLFYLIYDQLPRNKVLSRIRFHGRDELDKALARGSGVYLAMSHHGSHHVLGMLLSLLGYRLTGIRDRNEGAIRSYIQQTIGPKHPEFNAIQMLFADDFPRVIFRCFRENRLVISALDVNRDRGLNLKTCPVKIFGETREFLTGPMQIATRCRATVVPAFLVSRPDYYYRVMIGSPLYVHGERDENGNVPELNDLVQRYADAVAAHIRAYPDHLSRV
ncbi:MAG: lysophospholipid acyltransferase family protein [Phycisphaerae bacterium]|nr:lysophospholipid acyltransferase family protein [Phycisphaerae bacterium]